VHLADWPLVDSLPSDPTLVGAIDRVRQVCSAALALRSANKLRVRLPLASLRVAAPDAERLVQFADLIRDEVNVKDIQLTDDLAAHGTFEVTVNARAAGPRLGKDVQRVIKAVKAGQWTTSPSGGVIADGIELHRGEFERKLVSKDAGAAAELPASSGLVVLDTSVTPELEAEGLARDLVRVVQQARRDKGLDVSDRIRLTIDAPDAVTAAARTHEGLIRSETLALDVGYSGVNDGVGGKVGDGVDVRVEIAKVG
jgi:isoleucyl-tRNA synthetase